MAELVSIIVPVYNVAEYLDRCMQSLLHQTYGQLEIILVDDGSTDNSGDICDNYKAADSRVKVVHKSNAGLGMARNTGMDVATGNYFMFVDSDDYIELDAVEYLIKCAQYYDVQVVTSRFMYEDVIEKTQIKTGIYKGKEVVSDLLVHMLGSRKDKEDQLNLSSCTKLYSAEFIYTNKIKFPSERNLIWEDLAFNFEVLSNSPQVYVSDYAYYHYCYNGYSLTHKYNPQKFPQIMTMYDYIIRKLKALNMPEEAFIRVNSMFMGNIRTCMKLEAFYVRENGRKKTINNIRNMCMDKRLQQLTNALPNAEMSKQQVVYSFLIKKRCAFLLYFFAMLQNKRKRNLIN